MDNESLLEARYRNEQDRIKRFTDRLDIQEVFERKCLYLIKNYKDEEIKPLVLSIYGIGGSGKTELVNKLIRVIKGQKYCESLLYDSLVTDYVKYDLKQDDSARNTVTMLLRLRNMICEISKDYKFNLFDAALALYSAKLGVDLNLDKEASIILKACPWLTSITNATALVSHPGISLGAQIISAFSDIMGNVLQSFSRDREKIERYLEIMQDLEANEMAGLLPVYWIEDMKENVRKSEKPIIIFLDHYEEYSNANSNEDEYSQEDGWLYNGEKSFIRSLPGVMWVISGRESLYWYKCDEFWKNKGFKSLADYSKGTEEKKEEEAAFPIEEFLLSDFDEAYAKEYLKKVGIEDETLIKQLYELTNGTPLLLSICAEQFEDSDNKDKFWLEDFGKDSSKLISRYFSNIDKDSLDILYLIASASNWTIDDLKAVSKELSNYPQISRCAVDGFDRYLTKSYIIRINDELYKMHDTVREVALQKIPDSLRMAILDAEGELVKRDISYYEKMLYLLCESSFPEKDCIKYTDIIDSAINRIESVNKDYIYAAVYEKLYEKYKACYLSSEAYKNIAIEYLTALIRLEKSEKALMIGEEIIKNVSLDADDLKSLRLLARIAEAKGMACKFLEQLALLRPVSKRMLDLYPNEGETYSVLNNLAICYSEIGEMQTSLDCHEKAYEGLASVYGDEKETVLTTLVNLALSYESVGQIEKAEATIESAIKKIELMPQGLDSELGIHALSAKEIILFNEYKREEADKLCKEVCERCERVYSKAHPRYIEAMQHSVTFLENDKKIDEAIKLQKDLLAEIEKNIGIHHRWYLKAKQELARLYKEKEHYLDAVKIYEELVVAYKDNGYTENSGYISLLRDFSELLCEGGLENYGHALLLAQKANELSKRIYGNYSLSTINSMRQLAEVYIYMKKWREALFVATKISEYAKKQFGPKHIYYIQAEEDIRIVKAQFMRKNNRRK